MAHAAAALPVIGVLALISARRGNGEFCVWGAERSLWFSVILGIFGPLWLALAYVAEVLPYHAPLKQSLEPLFESAGLPWSSSMIAWLMGWFLTGLAWQSLKHVPSAHSYPVKTMLVPIGLTLSGAFCFFVTQILINWPFAGFPPGLEQERAIMAIWRNAGRTYFMGFCQAGAVSLVILPMLFKNFAPEWKAIGVRWLAFWATAGCLPHILVTWGASIGISLRSPAAFAQSMIPQTLALISLTLALGCWAFLLWKPRHVRILGLCGFGLLVARTLLPGILHFIYYTP